MTPDLIISRLDFDPYDNGEISTQYFFCLGKAIIGKNYFVRLIDESFKPEEFEPFPQDDPIHQAMLLQFPSLLKEKDSRLGAAMTTADLVVLEMLVSSRSTTNVIGG